MVGLISRIFSILLLYISFNSYAMHPSSREVHANPSSSSRIGVRASFSNADRRYGRSITGPLASTLPKLDESYWFEHERLGSNLVISKRRIEALPDDLKEKIYQMFGTRSIAECDLASALADDETIIDHGITDVDRWELTSLYDPDWQKPTIDTSSAKRIGFEEAKQKEEPTSQSFDAQFSEASGASSRNFDSQFGIDDTHVSLVDAPTLPDLKLTTPSDPSSDDLPDQSDSSQDQASHKELFDDGDIEADLAWDPQGEESGIQDLRIIGHIDDEDDTNNEKRDEDPSEPSLPDNPSNPELRNPFSFSFITVNGKNYFRKEGWYENPEDPQDRILAEDILERLNEKEQETADQLEKDKDEQKKLRELLIRLACLTKGIDYKPDEEEPEDKDREYSEHQHQQGDPYDSMREEKKNQREFLEKKGKELEERIKGEAQSSDPVVSLKAQAKLAVYDLSRDKDLLSSDSSSDRSYKASFYSRSTADSAKRAFAERAEELPKDYVRHKAIKKLESWGYYENTGSRSSRDIIQVQAEENQRRQAKADEWHYKYVTEPARKLSRLHPYLQGLVHEKYFEMDTHDLSTSRKRKLRKCIIKKAAAIAPGFTEEELERKREIQMQCKRRELNERLRKGSKLTDEEAASFYECFGTEEEKQLIGNEVAEKLKKLGFFQTWVEASDKFFSGLYTKEASVKLACKHRDRLKEFDEKRQHDAIIKAQVENRERLLTQIGSMQVGLRHVEAQQLDYEHRRQAALMAMGEIGSDPFMEGFGGADLPSEMQRVREMQRRAPIMQFCSPLKLLRQKQFEAVRARGFRPFQSQFAFTGNLGRSMAAHRRARIQDAYNEVCRQQEEEGLFVDNDSHNEEVAHDNESDDPDSTDKGSDGSRRRLDKGKKLVSPDELGDVENENEVETDLVTTNKESQVDRRIHDAVEQYKDGTADEMKSYNSEDSDEVRDQKLEAHLEKAIDIYRQIIENIGDKEVQREIFCALLQEAYEEYHAVYKSFSRIVFQRVCSNIEHYPSFVVNYVKSFRAFVGHFASLAGGDDSLGAQLLGIGEQASLTKDYSDSLQRFSDWYTNLNSYQQKEFWANFAGDSISSLPLNYALGSAVSDGLGRTGMVAFPKHGGISGLMRIGMSQAYRGFAYSPLMKTYLGYALRMQQFNPDLVANVPGVGAYSRAVNMVALGPEGISLQFQFPRFVMSERVARFASSQAAKSRSLVGCAIQERNISDLPKGIIRIPTSANRLRTIPKFGGRLPSDKELGEYLARMVGDGAGASITQALEREPHNLNGKFKDILQRASGKNVEISSKVNGLTSDDLKVLDESSKLLAAIPGFATKNGVVDRIAQCIGTDKSYSPYNLKGSLFELKAAIHVLKSGEEIVGLGIKLKSSTTSAEFDIVTKDTLIECKNVDWEKSLDDVFKKLRNQVGRSRPIALTAGKKYCIHFSKEPPNVVEEWLKYKNISYKVI